MEENKYEILWVCSYALFKQRNCGQRSGTCGEEEIEITQLLRR
jgi:hypothetical protein